MRLNDVEDDEKVVLNVEEIMIEDQDGFEGAEDTKIEEVAGEPESPEAQVMPFETPGAVDA